MPRPHLAKRLNLTFIGFCVLALAIASSSAAQQPDKTEFLKKARQTYYSLKDEGLAEYFSSVRVDNKQVEIGSDPELQASVKLDDVMETQQDTRPPRSLTELLGAQVWLSMADLFTMKHDTASYNEGTHNTLFYAQSWMVMHYLLHQKKLPETGAYFDLVLNQRVPVGARGPVRTSAPGANRTESRADPRRDALFDRL